MIISYTKKNYNYLISLSIFLFLVFSKLIIDPLKPITLVLFSLIILSIIIQNLNKTLKLQVNFFLLLTYLLFFFLDFNIEKIIFKSCVRGPCYQDYLVENKEKKLRINLLGKNFIENNKLIPLATYPNKKILGLNENGYWPIFKSDRYGFNNNDKIYNNQIISNLIIGDSFAQNITVNYKKSIQGLINKEGFKTLSFGVGGNGPLLNLATFKEYSNTINYQNLIYFFTETNDLFYDISVEKKNTILQNYLSNNFSQNLIGQEKEISRVLNVKSNEIYRDFKFSKKLSLKKMLRSFTLPNTRFILNITNSGKENNYNSFSFEKNLNFNKKDFFINSNEANIRIQNEVLKIINNSSHGAKLYLLYIPNKKNFLKNNKQNLFRAIKKISTINNFELIDLYEEVKMSDRKKLFPNNYQHFNENGQKRIAEIIIEKVNN